MREDKFRAWLIGETKRKDLKTDYSLYIGFSSSYALIKLKCNVKFELFKEVLDWMHNLIFQFYFEIESRFILSRVYYILDCLKEIGYRSNFSLSWNWIFAEFKTETFYELSEDEVVEFSKIFKQMCDINWLFNLHSLNCRISDLFHIILNWEVNQKHNIFRSLKNIIRMDIFIFINESSD